MVVVIDFAIGQIQHAKIPVLGNGPCHDASTLDGQGISPETEGT